MTTKTATTTRKAPEIRVHVGAPDEATIVDIGGQSYYATDLGDRVRLEKFSTQGGQVYTVRVGPKGCWGCNCPDATYRARLCKHTRAGDAFLDATF